MCFLLPGRAVPGSRRSRCNGRRHVGSALRTKSKASLQAEFSHARAPPDRPPPPAPRPSPLGARPGRAAGRSRHPGLSRARAEHCCGPGGGGGGGGPSTFPQPLPTPTRSQPPADATTRPSPGTQPRTPPANFEPQALIPATNNPSSPAVRAKLHEKGRGRATASRANWLEPTPPPLLPRSSIFSQVCLKVARRSDRPSLSLSSDHCCISPLTGFSHTTKRQEEGEWGWEKK